MIGSKWKFFLSRYILYGFLGLEIVILPFLLPEKKLYGDLEYYKSYISFLPLFLMGIHSGYLRCYYVDQKDYSTGLILGGFLLLIPFSILGSLYFDNFILFFSAISSGLAIFAEKIYQKKNMFLFAILFKPMFAVINILLLLVNYRFFKFTSDVVLIMSIANMITLAIYIFPSINDWLKKISFKDLVSQTSLLINRGFWLNLGTASLLFIIFTDRTYLKDLFPVELPDYSLAYSIAQVLFLFFTSFSYISEVKFGEKLSDITLQYFDSTLKFILKFYVLGVLGISVAFFIFINFLPSYDNSWKYFVLIVPSWGIFFAFGTLSILAQYLGLQRKMSLFILLLSLVNFVMFIFDNLFVLVFSPFWWVAKTSILVIIFSVYQVLSIRFKIRHTNEVS